MPFTGTLGARAPVARRAAPLRSRVAARAVPVDLAVSGMKCEDCTSAVEKALKEMSIVEKVQQVDLESGIAQVQLDVSGPSDAMRHIPELVEAIKKAGFEAEPRTA